MNATSRDAIRSQEAPRQRGGAAMRPATVVATGGGDLTVAINGGRIRALCAISCTAEPLAGDEVLVWAEEDGCHILAVLRRAGPADDSQTRPCDIDPDEGAPEPAFAGPFNGLPPVMAGGALPYQPHFDSQSDGEAAAGRPWTRFDVPLTPNAFGSGTYFRMGAYVDGQEGVMMPPLQLSKSTATTTTNTEPTPDLSLSSLLSGKNPYVSLAETANAASATSGSTTGTASGDAKQGYLKRGDSFVKNKAGQMELQTIATTAVTTTSSGDGFLAKTDADVNLSIDGGMLVDIVKGQTTNVSDGDIKFTSPAGVFAVSAASGISLTAGTPTAPANISLLAYGYVKNEAKGPLSEWFYSTSEKKTYGFAKDWFYGEKYSEFHGTSTSKFYGDEDKTFHGTAKSYFMGAQFTTNLAARISMTMAATLTLALGTEFRLNAAIDLKINLAIDMNIIIGTAIKVVVGFDIKLVAGSDFKVVSGMDIKNVGVDCKVVGLEVKAANIKSYLANTFLRTGAFDVDGKAVKTQAGFLFRS